MADKKISQLTAATTINAVDAFPLVQSGSTLQASIQTLLTNLPVDIHVIQAPETPASGALSTAIRASLVASASGVTNYTLASSTHGARKLISANSIGASATAVVTVTGGNGLATITFSAAGQAADLENISGYWYVIGYRGCTIA